MDCPATFNADHSLLEGSWRLPLPQAPVKTHRTTPAAAARQRFDVVQSVPRVMVEAFDIHRMHDGTPRRRPLSMCASARPTPSLDDVDYEQKMADIAARRRADTSLGLAGAWEDGWVLIHACAFGVVCVFCVWMVCMFCVCVYAQNACMFTCACCCDDRCLDSYKLPDLSADTPAFIRRPYTPPDHADPGLSGPQASALKASLAEKARRALAEEAGGKGPAKNSPRKTARFRHRWSRRQAARGDARGGVGAGRGGTGSGCGAGRRVGRAGWRS